MVKRALVGLVLWGAAGAVWLGGPGFAVPPRSEVAPAAKPLVPVAAQPILGSPVSSREAADLVRDRQSLLVAVDHSLRYLQTTKAAQDYRQYATTLGITRDRVRRSLVRFRQLLVRAKSAEALNAALAKEFVLYRAAGKDGQGTVGFTGYFEPVHVASRVPTAEFRYPIFRLPPNFTGWPQPHPTRSQLEGLDGLQFNQSALKGSALAWVRDRLEAYLIQVQGSARLQLVNGGTMTVGYAGATDYPYTSIGRELVNDGKIKLEDLTLPALMTYFQQHPDDLSVYLPRNQRFVFFKETRGSAATGSIGVPVTPTRSIATDKTLFPAGALALLQTQLPYASANGAFTQQAVRHLALDQDTGSAIKGPGRVDIFMGTGKTAGDRAGLINTTGQLYYLLLKP